MSKVFNSLTMGSVDRSLYKKPTITEASDGTNTYQTSLQGIIFITRFVMQFDKSYIANSEKLLSPNQSLVSRQI